MIVLHFHITGDHTGKLYKEEFATDKELTEFLNSQGDSIEVFQIEMEKFFAKKENRSFLMSVLHARIVCSLLVYLFLKSKLYA